MVRRDILIRSSQPPVEVLAALKARSREWRESSVPMRLREHGVYGVQIRVDGNRFRMRSEPTSTDRFELECRGTVQAEGSGSVILGKIRQDNPPLWVGQILLGGAVVNWALHPSWKSVAAGMAFTVAWALLAAFMILVVLNQSRHEAEASEFERILETAAWPPDKSSAAPVAV